MTKGNIRKSKRFLEIENQLTTIALAKFEGRREMAADWLGISCRSMTRRITNRLKNNV